MSLLRYTQLMKRLLDEHVHDAKRRRGEEVYAFGTLLPEHVGEVVSYSLESVVPVACLNKRFLGIVQERGGTHIWRHKDWCEELRPLVEASFAGAKRSDTEPLLLPFVNPYTKKIRDDAPAMIPWTILVEQWVNWNSWTQRKPATVDIVDNSIMYELESFYDDLELGDWVDDFELVPHDWLQGKMGQRRWYLIEETMNQAYWFLMRKLGHDLTQRIVLISYLSMLEYALREIWKQTATSATLAVKLIDLYNRWPVLNEWSTREVESIVETEFSADSLTKFGPPVVIQSLVKLLPFFAYENRANERMFNQIYNVKPEHRFEDVDEDDAEECVALAIALGLESPVRYAVQRGEPLEPKFCQLLGAIAVEHLHYGNVFDGPDQMLAFERGFLTTVPTTGAWKYYWACFNNNGIYKEFVEQRRLSSVLGEV
jgi:hypothetical protein